MGRTRARTILGTILGVTVAVLLGVGLGLGRVLGGAPDAGPVSTCDAPLAWHEAATAVGERAAVAGPVVATAYEPDLGGSPTFLNLGRPHPDPDRFDVVVYDDVRARFDQPPEVMFDGIEVCVRGRVRDRDGVPQIILESPAFVSPTG